MVRKTFTCVSLALFAALLLASCSIYDDTFESYWYSKDDKYQYGMWYYGKFEPVEVSQPLFPNFPSYYAMKYVGYGGYGRMIRRLVKQHEKTRIESATVKITVLDSNFKAYPDIEPVRVVFYRTDSENGKYIFETMKQHPLDDGYDPEKHGRYILFSKDPADQGIHGNFLVIHMKSSSDNFRYEVVEW
jgi:hypothetical protein